jgi:hypothetical protein
MICIRRVIQAQRQTANEGHRPSLAVAVRDINRIGMSQLSDGDHYDRASTAPVVVT